MSHQGEEGTEEGDGAKVSNVGVHVIVLLLGEQGVVTLDPATLHILVPTRLNVRLHQRGFTLTWCIKLQLLHLILHTKAQRISTLLVKKFTRHLMKTLHLYETMTSKYMVVLHDAQMHNWRKWFFCWLNDELNALPKCIHLIKKKRALYCKWPPASDLQWIRLFPSGINCIIM